MAAPLGAIGNHLFDIKRGRFHQRSSDAGAAGAEAAEPPGEVRPAAAAEIGMEEHDRVSLALKMFERKLEGPRTSSKLPEFVESVIAKPVISAGNVAKTLDVTPQAARRIVLELSLREMRRRGGFRAWGVI